MTLDTYYAVDVDPETLCYQLWRAHEPHLLDHFAGLTFKGLASHLHRQEMAATRGNDPDRACYFSTLRTRLTVREDGLWTEDNTGESIRLATPLTSVTSRPDPNLRRQAMDRGQRPGSDISVIQ